MKITRIIPPLIFNMAVVILSLFGLNQLTPVHCSPLSPNQMNNSTGQKIVAGKILQAFCADVIIAPLFFA